MHPTSNTRTHLALQLAVAAYFLAFLAAESCSITLRAAVQ